MGRSALIARPCTATLEIRLHLPRVLLKGLPAALQGAPGGTVGIFLDPRSDALEVALEVRLGDGALVHRAVPAEAGPMTLAEGGVPGRGLGGATGRAADAGHGVGNLWPVPDGQGRKVIGTVAVASSGSRPCLSQFAFIPQYGLEPTFCQRSWIISGGHS